MAGSGAVGGEAEAALNRRYSRALRRAETLGFVVLVLSIIVLILLLLP